MALAEQTPRLDEAFTWTRTAWGLGLTCAPLARIARHCFTTRALPLDGDLERVSEAWTLAAGEVGVDPTRLVRLKQVHGAHVVVASREQTSLPAPIEGDVLVSDDPELALAVQAADCVPLLLADPASGAVAAAHAGWRGTAARAAGAAVRALAMHYGAKPKDLVAAAGPSIGPCCYEVGGELPDIFRRAGHEEASIARWFIRRNGRDRLDLWRATQDQLEAAGLEPSRVHVARLCTVDHREWFCSYRAEGRGVGRIAAIIRRG